MARMMARRQAAAKLGAATIAAATVVALTACSLPGTSASADEIPAASPVAAVESGTDSGTDSGLATEALATQALAGTALAAVNRLAVKGRAPKTGYARSRFGPAWFDVDSNGCNTRDDVLAATLTNVRRNGCDVYDGYLRDPYSNTTVRERPYAIDLDHMVALSDAWQKGAQQWTYAKRLRFANDRLNLQPTLPSLNRQKGDSDVASWLPPNKAYRCTFVARIVAVKLTYGVWVTSAEKAAMQRVLGTCPTMRLPR